MSYLNRIKAELDLPSYIGKSELIVVTDINTSHFLLKD